MLKEFSVPQQPRAAVGGQRKGLSSSAKAHYLAESHPRGPGQYAVFLLASSAAACWSLKWFLLGQLAHQSDDLGLLGIPVLVACSP